MSIVRIHKIHELWCITIRWMISPCVLSFASIHNKTYFMITIMIRTLGLINQINLTDSKRDKVVYQY